VAPASPGLPDALVLAVPVVADPVDEATQRYPQVVGDGSAVLVVQIDGVDQLAVNVELELAHGVVADSDRPRAPIALQAEQFLTGRGAAVHPVEDLQRPVGVELAAPRLQEGHEAGRLFGKADAQ